MLCAFTAGASALFAMTEKRFLGLADGQIVLLSNLSVVGSMAGMFLGGRFIDRHGTRWVFAGCHLTMGALLGAFLLRGLFPPGTAMLTYLGLIHLLTGATRGAVGIAMTTELMGLLPERDQSLASASFAMFRLFGVALSGLVPAWILRTGLLQENWSFAALELGPYDAILVLYSFLTLISIATLNLVPAIRRKAEATSLGTNRL